MKNMTECARSAVVLDGEISKNVDIWQRTCTRMYVVTQPIQDTWYVYVNDLTVAVEAARQGVTVGEDTVSGLMFADDFVGISETPEGLQKQIENALECTRKWRVTANVKKYAVPGSCL